MKKVILFSIVCLGLSVFISSCAKKGCTNPLATNYDSGAKSDDGTCTYQGKVVIWADQTFADAAVTEGIATWNFSIGGAPVGSMATSTYFASAPSCGATGAVTIVKDLGTQSSKDFTIDVTNETGAAVATYTVTFKGGTCSNWKLN